MSEDAARLHLVLGDEELLVERAVSSVLRAVRKQAGTGPHPIHRDVVGAGLLACLPKDGSNRTLDKQFLVAQHQV